MSKYIINWMKIKNFKVFDEFIIDFNDSRLICFGAPNGYGKTTIFDAIELGMTGNINRIKSIELCPQNCLIKRYFNEKDLIKINKNLMSYIGLKAYESKRIG